MKLYRFETQLNHGQRWTDYDVLAPNIEAALVLARKVITREEGLTGKPVKFQDQTSGPKEVDITTVREVSARVWAK